jgi:hypothetical protein
MRFTNLTFNAVPESFFKYTWFNIGDIARENQHVQEMFDVVLDVRTSLNQIIGDNDRRQVWAEIICNQKSYKLLQV